LTVRLRFDGAAKGAVEKVEVDIATVVIAGRLPEAADRLIQTERVGGDAPTLAHPSLSVRRIGFGLQSAPPRRTPVRSAEAPGGSRRSSRNGTG